MKAIEVPEQQGYYSPSREWHIQDAWVWSMFDIERARGIRSGVDMMLALTRLQLLARWSGWTASQCNCGVFAGDN